MTSEWTNKRVGRPNDAIAATDHQLSQVRERYLDLMVKTLANVIYGEPLTQRRKLRHWLRSLGNRMLGDKVIAPVPERSFEETRAEGRDWPALAHTMVGLRRLNNLRELTARALVENVPGHFIETGVWRGGCCLLMKAVLEAYGARERRVYVADSFAGLPRPKPDLYPADRKDRLYQRDELRVPVEEVRANFAKYGLLDDHVIFLEGLFQETLPRFEESQLALIRLDGDMYESTTVALQALYPKVAPGGFIIIDDYGAVAACKQAVTDFRQQLSITDELHRIDWTGVWWRKSSGS